MCGGTLPPMTSFCCMYSACVMSAIYFVFSMIANYFCKIAILFVQVQSKVLYKIMFHCVVIGLGVIIVMRL